MIGWFQKAAVVFGSIKVLLASLFLSIYREIFYRALMLILFQAFPFFQLLLILKAIVMLM